MIWLVKIVLEAVGAATVTYYALKPFGRRHNAKKDR